MTYLTANESSDSVYLFRYIQPFCPWDAGTSREHRLYLYFAHLFLSIISHAGGHHKQR